jgi:hypothetical protein
MSMVSGWLMELAARYTHVSVAYTAAVLSSATPAQYRRLFGAGTPQPIASW